MLAPLQTRPVFVTPEEAVYRTTATLIYDPKHDRTKFKKWYLIARVDPGLVRYYQSWIWKFCNTKLTDSAWKPHCTVIRGEVPRNDIVWRKYEGSTVELFYSPEFLTNGHHWWLPVYAPALERIRGELGIKPRPHVPFHITIGTAAY
jgi:hypothetical protein